MKEANDKISSIFISGGREFKIDTDGANVALAQEDISDSIINPDNESTVITELCPNVSRTIVTQKRESSTQSSEVERLLTEVLLTSGTQSQKVSDTNIIPKYQYLKEIGQGGMGKVDVWKDNYLQRVVCAKTLLPDNAQSERAVRRFWEEGQIAGQLDHPNIIPIHDLGVDQDRNIFFTMKYVQGRSLQSIIDELIEQPEKRKNEWSLQRMLQIFQTICYAIEYAHSKKVIHRDLKPDNIMLGNFGEVIVMDWGLAKVLDQGEEVFSEDSVSTLRTQGGFKTISGEIAGTPYYMSPEQAKGNVKVMDHRSDIYSLGTILYHMITGKRVVEEENIFAILYKVTEGEFIPVPKTGLFGVIPKELKCIIEKAMQFHPENRYQSAREIAEEIHRFLDGRPIKSCHYSILEKFNKFLYRRRKEISIVLVTSVLMLIGFGVWSKYQQYQDSHWYMAEAQNILNSPDVKQSRDYFKYTQNLDPAKSMSYYAILKQASLKSTGRCHDGYENMKCLACKQFLEPFAEKQANIWMEYYRAAEKMRDKAGMEMAERQIKSVLTANVFHENYEKELQK